MKKRLYIGVDDSNHAGTRKGEIILATFSYDCNDEVIQNFKNKRDHEIVLNWLKRESSDYRYTLLIGEYWRHRSDNLVTTAPFLIQDYLKSKSDISSISIFIDGRLDSDGKKHLVQNYGNISDIKVLNFIKKGKDKKGHFFKHPQCPKVLYIADILANIVYHKNLDEILMSEKMVSIP